MPLLSRRDFIRHCSAAALALYARAALAANLLRLNSAELKPRGAAYVLSGSYSVKLTPTLEDALQKGITFSFVQAFEAERPRSFWFAESIAVLRRTRMLGYNALLREYQLDAGGQRETFDNLPDALHALGQLDDWPVLERSQLDQDDLYRARVRMYLDSSKLPKPLQLNAFASERWDLDSGWREWSFKP